MHELFKETSRLRIELTSRDAGLNVGPSELRRPDRQIQDMKRDEHQDQLSIHVVEISLPFKVAFNFCWMFVTSQFGLRTHFWHLHVRTKASQLCFEALKPSWGWKNLQSILETAFNLLIWKNYLFLKWAFTFSRRLSRFLCFDGVIHQSNF